MSHFNTMVSNIVEIAYVGKVAIGEEEPLVANGLGTRLYASSVGWGRLWRWIYHIGGRRYSEGRREAKMAHVLEATRRVFCEEMLKLRQGVTLYKESFARSNVSSTDLREARSSIYRCSEGLGILVNEKSVVDAINALFYKAHQKGVVGASYLLADMDRYYLDEAYALRSVVDVETATGEQWPLSSLRKLCEGQVLSPRENFDLVRWCKKLDMVGMGVNLNTLHTALCRLVDDGAFGCRTHEDIGTIEWELIKRGCQCLTKGDTAHIRWRESLKTGDRVRCNGKEYTIIAREYVDGNKVAFTIDGDADKLLLVSDSLAALGIETRKERTLAWGVPSPEVYDLDSVGRCAVVERLQMPVSCYRWESGALPLTDNDLRRAKPLANMLRWFCEEDRSPYSFSVEDLWYDNVGDIKSRVIFEEGSFDYNSLEQLILDCCKGKRAVFMHIIRESLLAQHPVNGFYESMVAKALHDNKDVDVSLEAAFIRIGDGRVVRRAQHLCQDVRSIKQQCKHLLRAYYEVTLNDKEFDKVIAEQILAALDGVVALMDDLLVDDIIKRVAQSEHFVPRSQRFSTNAKK